MFKISVTVFLFLIRTFAQTDYTSEKSRIDALLTESFFESTGISISVYDLTENKSVYEKDARKLFRPASNMKILTSSAGLLFLGSEYKFITSLFYTGSIINKTLYGDIYVKGGLDPDFKQGDLDSLIKPLLNTGVKEISGNIFFDISAKDSLFWGNGWMWDDDPSTDAPYLSALNINDNAIKVLIKPGKNAGPAVITTEPVTQYVNILNKTLTSGDAEESAFITRSWINRTNEIIATGVVSPADSEYSVVINIFKPEEYFAALFKERLKEKAIFSKSSGSFSKIPNNAIKLSSVERSYDSVLVNLNKISDNLSAEMVLYALGEKYFGNPASAKNGLLLIDSLITLSGNNPGDYVLADGSGVSHYNLITTSLINSILKYFYYNRFELFQKLYNSFPSAGADGTLRTRMRGTSSENNVHAKTGTLSGVSSLSGYLTTQKGNLLSFSIMIQNYKGTSATARNYQDMICNILTGL